MYSKRILFPGFGALGCNKAAGRSRRSLNRTNIAAPKAAMKNAIAAWMIGGQS